MNDLPNAIDVDTDTITGPVQTRQGWVTPTGAAALREILTEVERHAGSGFARQRRADAEKLAARLRNKYATNPEKLAEIGRLMA